LRKKAVFFLITFSHALVHIVPASLSPLLPFIREEFRLSYTYVGILTFILSLCWAFSSIPAGIIADRVNKNKLLLFIFASLGFLSVSIAFMSTFSGVVLILIFLSLSVGFFHPPAYTYISRVFSSERGKTIGAFETGGSLGVLIAPLVAGLVGSYFGWRYVYTLWAVPSFAVAFIFYTYRLSLLKEEIPAKDGKVNKTSSFSHTGEKSTAGSSLKIIYLAQGFFGFISGGSVSFLPLFLTDVHKLSPVVAGGMLTMFLAGGVVGKIVGGRYSDILGARKVIVLGFFFTFLFLVLASFLKGLFLIPALILAGISLFMILPALFVFTSQVALVDLGLAYGIQILSGSGFGAFSRIIAGVVSDFLGIRYVFFLLSFFAFFSALFLQVYLKDANDGREVDIDSRKENKR